MKIEWIRIKGFRNFDNETINFNNKTLIIGGNDVGKTNLLYALRILLDKSLSQRDIELTDSDYNVYTQSDEIEITIKLVNVIEDCLRSVFAGDVENDAVHIQYTNSKNGDFQIKAGPTEDMLDIKSSRFYLKRLNLEYVDTNRDLFRYIKKEKANLLKISKEKLSAENKAQDDLAFQEIQGQLNELNGNIESLNYIGNSLEKVNSELGNLAIHNEDQLVKFNTSNGDATELLKNLELSYVAGDNTLKIGGDGRNNQIFLALWVAKQKMEETRERVTLFAIEEPEAHLHPHQQRKLSKYLTNSFANQVFISTHSPQIASEFTPEGIVRLFVKHKVAKVAQGGCCNKIETSFDSFGYRLNAISAEVFFSNGVFLVEGPSEILFYKALSISLGIDLDRLNISIISVNGIGFKPYIRICQALEIPYVMRTDDDIFRKTVRNIAYSYFAGISRVMGIYNLLIGSGNQDELTVYWENHKLENQWEYVLGEPSQESFDLNNYIREQLEEKNIYLAVNNLEEDLIDSELCDSLKAHYNTTDENILLSKMQLRKAENMLTYLSEQLDDLTLLNDDEISSPLLKIEEIVKELVASDV